MIKILYSILVCLMVLFSNTARASVTDLKLSTAQIFDVQWYISGGTLYASGFNYIYASVNYATQTTSAARWTSAQTTDANSNGRYIGFFNSTTNPGTYGMAVYNSDGTVYKIINNTGSFAALANGAIFYNGNGMWGTLITTGQGYSNGQSGSWAVTQSNPTNAQLQAYVPPSSTPLSAGQTAAPAAPSFAGTLTQTNAPSNQVVTSGSSSTAGITAAQQTKVNAWAAATISNNGIYIEQIGDNNTTTVKQTGNQNLIRGIGQQRAKIDGDNNQLIINQGTSGIGQNQISLNVVGDLNKLDLAQANNNKGVATGSNGHYLYLDIAGSNNNVTTQQTNNGGVGGHYMETIVTGNSNNIINKQLDNGNKTMFATVAGNNNTATATQQGTGQHYLDFKLSGNGNSASVNQSGSTQNKASIDLTNAGGAASLSLTQTGGQAFSIMQSCAMAGGCSTTVTQP